MLEWEKLLVGDYSMSVYLRSLRLLKEEIPNSLKQSYPFTISSIRNLEELQFNKGVTFFVGENGSGKSTLLEAIAYQCGFHTAGGSKNNRYDVDASESDLGNHIRLSWMPKMQNGFFLRAETFYHFASHLDQVDTTGYKYYGGKSLHEQSHGEAFLSLFTNRFTDRGIYLLDEPEAALSPTRQLSFLYILHEMTRKQQAQFIIATHSPILLGYPDAEIFNFDSSPVTTIAYEETDHYYVTKRFLENRERFLDQLFEEEKEG